MLRITTIENGDSPTTLKLEGKLLEPWIAELRNACSAACQRNTLVALDLTGVSYVDASGATILRELRQYGMQLVGCSPLVAELVGETNPLC
jgi:ABC-type transporter Mla MlaB component